VVQQIIFVGLVNSATYFLLALGFSLIFGVARIINLSHTALYMVSAYLVFSLIHFFGANTLLAIVFSVVATASLAALLYKFLIERIREHELTVIIITVALALILQECMAIAFGSHYRGVDTYVSGNVDVLGVSIANQHLIILAVATFCAGCVSLWLWKSRIGLAIRVTAQDREIANLMGINVDAMCLIVTAVAGALAAVAGAMIAPLRAIEPRMWLSPLVIVMATVILGGLGSIKGSLLGAIILGFTETLVVFLIPLGGFLKGVAAMAIMILVLLVRPEGLFGAVFEEERL